MMLRVIIGFIFIFFGFRLFYEFGHFGAPITYSISSLLVIIGFVIIFYPFIERNFEKIKIETACTFKCVGFDYVRVLSNNTCMCYAFLDNGTVIVYNNTNARKREVFYYG